MPDVIEFKWVLEQMGCNEFQNKTQFLWRVLKLWHRFKNKMCMDTAVYGWRWGVIVTTSARRYVRTWRWRVATSCSRLWFKGRKVSVRSARRQKLPELKRRQRESLHQRQKMTLMCADVTGGDVRLVDHILVIHLFIIFKKVPFFTFRNDYSYKRYRQWRRKRRPKKLPASRAFLSFLVCTITHITYAASQTIRLLKRHTLVSFSGYGNGKNNWRRKAGAKILVTY